MPNWKQTFFKQLVVAVFLGAIVGCGSGNDANIVPAGGTLSINGGPATSFFLTDVAISNQATTVTVTMTNTVSLNGGQTSLRTVTLVLPNNNIGGSIDLATTTGTKITEVTRSSTGTTLSTDFTSTGVTGNAVIQFLTPVSIGGVFNANFTGANSTSRAITNGTFVLNN